MKGAGIVGGGAVVATALGGCLPTDEALLSGARATVTADTKEKEAAEAQKAVERATLEAPMREMERKVELVKAQKEALGKAIKDNFFKRNSSWYLVGEAEFFGGETNPLATDERQVFTQPPNSGDGRGLKIRTSPAPDGEEVTTLKDLARLGEYRYRVEVRKQDGSGKMIWAAVENKEISKYASLPSKPEPLLVKDKLGEEHRYYFYCLDELGQKYTREFRTKP